MVSLSDDGNIYPYQHGQAFEIFSQRDSENMTCGGFYTIIFARPTAVRKEGEKENLTESQEKIGHIFAYRRGTKLNSFFYSANKMSPKEGEKKIRGGQKKAFSCFQCHTFK